MLAPLIDDKQKISLIENSGVQFLDFGLQLSDTEIFCLSSIRGASIVIYSHA